MCNVCIFIPLNFPSSSVGNKGCGEDTMKMKPNLCEVVQKFCKKYRNTSESPTHEYEIIKYFHFKVTCFK